MNAPICILHLEDQPTDAALIRSILEADGLDHRILWARTREEFCDAILSEHFDLILSDYTLPSFDGLSALALAREACPDTPFLFVSGTIGEEAAIEALKQGATDYLLKDRLSRLVPAIERARREAAERRERQKMEAQLLRTQRLESIGALAAGITHDLNNALAPVLMGVEHLEEETLSPMGNRILDVMRASTLRSAQMIKQVLSFAQGVENARGTLNLKPLVREMEELARQTFPRSIVIESHVGAPLAPIVGNVTQMHQVLLNLCINARDAMPDGGRLRIEARNEVLDQKVFRGESAPVSGSFVALTISDSGTGIAPELQERMFEPFFTTKSPGEGTGLGLATVRGIVKAHGGFLQMSSEVGKGTTFTIHFPAAASSEKGAAPEAAADSMMGDGQLILLVDDELAILQMMRAFLEANRYRVLTASHGVEALKLCQQHPGEVAAVVTDLMMPFMDGPTLIHALRKADPSIAIIGITGLSPTTSLGRSGREQTDVLLQKPFAVGDLLGSLRSVLAGRGRGNLQSNGQKSESVRLNH